MAPALIQEVDEDQTSISVSQLELTPVESTLRRLLLDVAKYIDEHPLSTNADTQVALPAELEQQPIVLRFTGGWVRDKLLGTDSHDIDISINKMTGYQFGLRMKEYLQIPGNAERYGLEGVATEDRRKENAGSVDKSKTVGDLHKIDANPERSKHLETVTTRVLGLDIDLVNLRKETYTDESRNPSMEFGTPEEDAIRRDATVNAMFYNINTETVEDFTGEGRNDMKKRILRTPLDPYQTFKDDPLRVLRLIRFAGRLGYEIAQEAKTAMGNLEIKDALRRKISRERVGIEIDKSLHGPDPYETLRLVFGLGLYETIFCDPTSNPSEHYQADTEGWEIIIDYLRDNLDAEGPLFELLVRNKEDRFLAWQLAAFFPYRDAPQPQPTDQGRKAQPPVAISVAREGIKAPNKISDILLAAVRHQSEISDLVDRFHSQSRRPERKTEGDDAAARDVLGMAIRRWGPTWRSQVVYALLVDFANNPGDLEAISRRYTSFTRHLHDLSILDAYSFKPLIDGKALAKALGATPGVWMKDALDVVMAYQLRHPHDADPADAIAEVKLAQQGQQQHGGELASSLIHHFLKLTIRPLFTKATPSSITEAGRKNTRTILPKKMTVEGMEETQMKPWKSGANAYVLDLLGWSIKALSEDLTRQVWNLAIPPILSLLDDWETKFKCLGAELTRHLFKATPPDLLERTGLGEVFQDALLPCLTYIPPITPEDESVPLLTEIYPALLALADIRHGAPPPPQAPASATTPAGPRIKFLDAVIRRGIIYGYTHSSTHPRIVSILFTHLIPLVDAEGLQSVRHLQYLLPILTETLSHPLADTTFKTSREALLSATRATQALIRNAWPRMVEHRGEVLKGLTLCWAKSGAEASSSPSSLRAEMKHAVDMLRAAVGHRVDFEHECALLVDADPRLDALLLPRAAT